MKKLKLFLFFIPLISFCQEKTIFIIDSDTKKPLIGVQVLSQEGSLLSSTDNKGQFKLIVSNENFKETLIIYKSGYEIIEYSLKNIPHKIELRQKNELLEEVVIKVKVKKPKYFKIKGYVRSWQLINKKLIKYGDAMVEYLIPYKESNNDVVTGIKKYVTQFRTFKIDSIKDKSRIISFSSYDYFFDTKIPKRDILKRNSYENYNIKTNENDISDIYKDDLLVGYVILKNSIPNEISIDENPKNENIKNALGTFTFGNKTLEKWANKGNKRFIKYFFRYNQKGLKTKLGIKNIETVNEVFITDFSYNSDKKPRKSKKHIDKDISYYFENFWSKEIQKHPLPSYIESQLIKVNENKNKY